MLLIRLPQQVRLLELPLTLLLQLREVTQLWQILEVRMTLQQQAQHELQQLLLLWPLQQAQPLLQALLS